MKQWAISVFSFLTLLFLLSPSGARADELATVTGYVTDPSGLRIAGAKVQATNVETNVSYSGESNGEGLFRIGSIPTGSYRVGMLPIRKSPSPFDSPEYETFVST